MFKKVDIEVIKMIEDYLKEKYGDDYKIVFVDNQETGPYFFMQNEEDNRDFLAVPVERVLNVIEKKRIERGSKATN